MKASAQRRRRRPRPPVRKLGHLRNASIRFTEKSVPCVDDTRGRLFLLRFRARAVSSVVEHRPYKPGVAGSKPAPPPNKIPSAPHFETSARIAIELMRQVRRGGDLNHKRPTPD